MGLMLFVRQMIENYAAGGEVLGCRDTAGFLEINGHICIKYFVVDIYLAWIYLIGTI